MGDSCRLFAAAAVVVAVVAVSTEARADRVIDGNRLYELCRPNGRSSTFCGDYVLSIADAMMVGMDRLHSKWPDRRPGGRCGDEVCRDASRETRISGIGAGRRSPCRGLPVPLMDEPIPAIDPAEARRCTVCGEHASYGFSPLGFPLQPAEAWYCGSHRHQGERAWAARYRHGTA
jgi:hypothetical protein